MLHTGLRAGEVCRLKAEEVTNEKRSGRVRALGKGNKYREVPINATVRKVLGEYRPKLSKETGYLFTSEKTGAALTERGLGYLIKNMPAKHG